MKHFKNCKSIEEVKSLYKQLAKQHHPDCGGDTATMQEINTEYAYACAHILKGENLSTEDREEQIRLSEEYRQVVEQIINLPGIQIEIIGNWLWVSGNTYPVRKELKAAGLFFAPTKKVWFYRSEDYRSKGGKKTLDEICQKYGSEKVNSSGRNNVLE